MTDLSRALSLGALLLAPVAILAAVVAGSVAGLGTALLVLAGAMLVGAVLLFWSSLERLSGESMLTLDEAIGYGAPSAEEERKQSLLRALKDLEYERSVGKISDEDYAELATKYRSEAKALLQALDGELAPLRKKAEDRLAARLAEVEASDARPKGGKNKRRSKARDGAAASADGEAKPAEEAAEAAARPPADPEEDAAAPDAPRAVDSGSAPEAPAESEPGAEPQAAEPKAADARACPSCATRNDGDAAFCKRCGAALVAAEGAP